MSFSSGVFSINTTGQPVVAGTTISATVFNALTADLATGLSTCILKDGTQTATAGIPFYAGTVALPGIYLGTDNSTGFYRIGADNPGLSIAGTKLIDWNSTGETITGTLTVSSTVAVNGTAITTTSATLTAFAGATTLLTMGGTGASAVVAIPGTLEQSATTGALTVAGGVYIAKKLNVVGHVTFEGVTSTGATGTGKLVYDGTPTLVTPHLGVASATSLSFGGGVLSTYVAKTAWTPVLKFGGGTTGITYATQAGSCVQVGDEVTVTFLIQLSNKGSSTGDATITGLPVASGVTFYGSVTVQAVTYTGETQLNVATGNPQTINLLFNTEAGVATNLADTNFANNSLVSATFSYFV